MNFPGRVTLALKGLILIKDFKSHKMMMIMWILDPWLTTKLTRLLYNILPRLCVHYIFPFKISQES